MISSWVTDAAPWRCAVPRQSAPVSPPPMITTCLPAAMIGESRSPVHPVGQRQVLHRLVDAVQLAAGHRQVARRPARRRRAPPRRSPRSCCRGESIADVALVTNLVPSASICASRRSRCALFHLELGDAVARAARRSGRRARRRSTCVPGPGELLGGGEPGRAGADDRDPLAGADERQDGRRRQPSAQARSMISTSTCLIVTGSCVDAEHARGLARRRAQPPGELREVVRRVQPVDRVRPVDRGRPGRSTRG